MDFVKIPLEGRSGGLLRPCYPGLSLPRWFLDELWAIDSDIYPIFHPYKVLWDDFINDYEGPLDDPRYTIGVPSGFSEELWGYPTKQPRSSNPVEDGKWHLWRLCKGVGAWAHITRIEDKAPKHLDFILKRLFFQATYRERYGDKAYNEKLQENEKEAQEKTMEKNADLLKDIQKENKGMLTEVMENFSRGKVAPTNPQVDKIVSYPGQKNHTKTTRDAMDEDGGLILPFKRN